MSAPQSTIYICSGVRINSRYEHTIYFADAGAQQAYFAGKVVKPYEAYTFLRKSWPIKVEATMEEAKTWSYLFFRNSPSGKIYYYFINNVEYINDNTVELRLELDVMQTYMFDYTRLPCYVERQHVTNDTPGLHTIDEGLEVGEFVSDLVYKYDMSDLCIMVMATINPNITEEELAEPAKPGMYNNIFSGIKIWAIDGKDWADWGNQLEQLDDIGQPESIISMWMYPKKLIELGGEDRWSEENLAHTVGEAGFDTFEGPQWNTTLDGYNPRNKKLLCYPYNFILATNHSGSFATYRYELFDGLYSASGIEQTQFTINGALGPDGGVMMTPNNYKGLQLNQGEAMTLGGFPTCAWNSDMYKVWLAQNQNTHALSTSMSGIKIAGGILTAFGSLFAGNIGGAVGGIGLAASGGQQIAQHLAQKADMDIIPPQAKGSFSSSLNMVTDMHTFSLFCKTIRAEQAKVLDDYFSMYGYKISRVQAPNIHAREKWTYIKTIDCHIAGNLCNEDLTKIESIYDKGITFWVSGDSVCEYFDEEGNFYKNNPLQSEV